MKVRIFAVALIILLLMGGCKAVDEERHASLAQGLEQQEPSQPEAPAPEEKPEKPNIEPPQQMPTKEPDEESEEQPNQRVEPVCFRQIHPLEGPLFSLTQEESGIIHRLLEAGAWVEGTGGYLYQPHEMEFIIGEETCGYHMHHGIFLVEGGSVRLDSAAMEQVHGILTKYLGFYGVSTVAKISGEPLVGRRKLSQEDVQAVVEIIKRFGEDELWREMPAEFTAEIEWIIENTGFYYDSALGLIGMEKRVFSPGQEAQAKLNAVLERYIPF